MAVSGQAVVVKPNARSPSALVWARKMPHLNDVESSCPTPHQLVIPKFFSYRLAEQSQGTRRFHAVERPKQGRRDLNSVRKKVPLT